MTLPTTAAAIRDRMLDVIEAIVPGILASDRFLRLLEDDDAELRTWSEAFPQAAFRRVEVRDDGEDDGPAVTNLDIEERLVRFVVTIAYPHTWRTGDGGMLDLDAAMEADELQVDAAIGMAGRENFAPPHPDACWRLDGSEPPERQAGAGCSFLVFTLQMSFVQSFA